jgi:phosphoadenosine phosphosulfate reductase
MIETFNTQATMDRLAFLEQQAEGALRKSVDNFESPVFPCALIAGDVVILHLLHKFDLMDKGVLPCCRMLEIMSMHACMTS